MNIKEEKISKIKEILKEVGIHDIVEITGKNKCKVVDTKGGIPTISGTIDEVLETVYIMFG